MFVPRPGAFVVRSGAFVSGTTALVVWTSLFVVETTTLPRGHSRSSVATTTVAARQSCWHV